MSPAEARAAQKRERERQERRIRAQHQTALERAAEQREEAIIRIDETYRRRCARADDRLGAHLAALDAATEKP